jgi:hypothetical protein
VLGTSRHKPTATRRNGIPRSARSEKECSVTNGQDRSGNKKELCWRNRPYSVTAALVEPCPWKFSALSDVGDNPFAADWTRDEREEDGWWDGVRRRGRSRHDCFCHGSAGELGLWDLGRAVFGN